MFTARLNELFQYLGAKNAPVAKLAGFDRTNISRLRSSGRIPVRSSPTVRKLVTGLYLYADNRNELEKLCGYIGADPAGSAEEITEKLKEWLYEGEPEGGRTAVTPKAAPRNTKKPKPVYRFFGERLDAVMKLTDLSNARLSHAIHMDTSRNGRQELQRGCWGSLMAADDMAGIIHAKRPELSFGFTHPLMCRAFQSYAEALMEQYRIDRNTLRHKLEMRIL